MRIAVVTLGWADYGGWPTYTKHLSRGLQQIERVEHRVVVIGSGKPRREWKSLLPFADQSFLEMADLIYIVLFRAKERQAIRLMRQSGKPIIILLHDPTEWRRKEAAYFLQWLQPIQIQFIGPQTRSTFRKSNPWCPPYRLSTHLHPYYRISDGNTDATRRTQRAICTARIDFDKRTHLIVQADCGVELWTGYIDWRYDWQKFGGKAKSLSVYQGPFGVDDESVRSVYQDACVLVDMSHIKGDGGRTQYTFLEAMDFGLSLVLAADWSRSSRSELQPHEHFYPASTPQDIVEGIQQARERGNLYAGAHQKVLQRHDAIKVCADLVDEFQKAFGGVGDDY